MTDLTELEAAAKAATPGDRYRVGDTVYAHGAGHPLLRVYDIGKSLGQPEADARFIALANPAAILELLSERLALLARIEEVEGERDDAKADRNAHADHVLRVAREADDGMAALDDMDEAWEATGEIGNRKHLTLAEQIGSIVRERDAADARALSAEAAQARAEFLLAVMAACWDGMVETGGAFVRAGGREMKGRLAAEAALRASQDALGKAVEGLEMIGDEYRPPSPPGVTLHEALAQEYRRIKSIARQTLAQIRGVGEEQDCIPGSVTDDLRASRGEGSGA